jgi:hypothetical protein
VVFGQGHALVWGWSCGGDDLAGRDHVVFPGWILRLLSNCTDFLAESQSDRLCPPSMSLRNRKNIRQIS